LPGDPAWPTVTIYNHLDVQPADGPEWRTDPFRFTRRGDRYFARGTTDDKGPALAALWGASYAVRHGARVNVRFLWELEEEIGSPHFENAIRRYARKLATDSVVVSDTIWVSRSQPACPAGLRGLQGLRLHLRTAEHDAHSGTTGGAARNPVAELAQLLAEMHDARTGRVLIPGFMPDVVRPAARVRPSPLGLHPRAPARITLPPEERRGLDVMQRPWLRPTFRHVRWRLPRSGVKTVVLPEATAIVSCRLSRGCAPSESRARQDRARLLSRRKVTAEHALEPYEGRTSGPHADAIREAVRFAFGKRPVFVREGGSIGAVLSMERVLGAPVFFLGLSLPEHGYHAPNENFDWRQASGGIVAFVKYFEQIAALGRLPGAPAARPRRRGSRRAS
jgi:acetylornithine deacetylase/succinyl-diaminopimelate desuccinylase-like protein